MPDWMKMARSVFYYHRSHLNDNDGYDETRSSIRRIYNNNKGRYGYRRVCMELRNEGVIVNHKTVQKLMSQMELKAKTVRRHYHSYKGEVGKTAPTSFGVTSRQTGLTGNGHRCHAGVH